MRVPSFHAFRSGRAGVVVADPTTKLWSWGGNGYGELGLGNTTNRSSPVQVGALTTWSNVFGGTNCSFAIKTDGTLWAWGLNTSGQLGLGNTTNRSSPVQVGALTDWSDAKISSRLASTLAVKSNGTLWAWGSPFNGVLGLGDATNRSSPVQVGTLTNWAEVSVGRENVLAVKTDGTLWSWGLNTQGQLGQGNTTSRSSPVQVGALTTWSKVAAIAGVGLATKTDGTLWSWGRNNYGQLGQGNLTDRSSPVQVGTLTNWSKIAGGGGRYVSGNPFIYYAYIYGFFSSIKTDGTLWSWGLNTSGQLGIGHDASRSSPVQVGALTTWSKLSINSHMKYRRNNNTAVIKTDGTLWAWGSNLTGAFANGTSGYRSSPVQVLSGTSGWDWVSVISSNDYGNSSSIIAIRTT